VLHLALQPALHLPGENLVSPDFVSNHERINLPACLNMEEAIKKLRAFRDARDWKKFHNPKDLALALSIEASELAEVFLWKSAEEADIARVREELADVLAYALLLADHYELDAQQIILDKIELNERKYPVDKARGSARKYTEL